MFDDEDEIEYPESRETYQDRCDAIREQWREQEIEGRRKRVCPDCGGSGLSPYKWDGGSCPHCFGGYVD